VPLTLPVHSQSVDTVRTVMDSIPVLVTEANEIKRRQKEDGDRLKEISAALVKAGAGEHTGSDGSTALVICPSPTVKYIEDNHAQLQKLAGDEFYSLFERKVTYAPVKAMRDVAKALLTPAKARKLIALSEVPSTAFVKFSG
jgi:hypothetical protein